MGVVVVAYNASATLKTVLDRLPPSFAVTVDHVLVSDDASGDGTYEVGIAYKDSSVLPMTVIRHPENLGYGGNQKSGYRWAIERGLDVVVLLHGDGQYAPEVVEDLVQPIVDGSADAVMGSRMMLPGSARAGGMPLYKYVGNRILTTFQNRLTGLRLCEWHSGYRAYRVEALRELPLNSYSDGFDFDTEIILGLHQSGKRILEVPIPTYYGGEICYVNGVKYAADVTRDVVRYRLNQAGLGIGLADETPEAPYELKPSPHSSHGRLLDRLARQAPARILDVGCSDGRFGELLQQQGHSVIGVDRHKYEGVASRLDDFVEADLDHGLPEALTGTYPVIVAADVLEHVAEPAQLLSTLASMLTGDGRIFVSVPNFAHWYPRLRVAAGRFDYDQRGILDRTHLRFFTRRSMERMVRATGLRIVERDVVGTPLNLFTGADEPTRLISLMERMDRRAVRAWPTLFGYQFLYELAAA